jgi:hypothetical protein
MAVGGDESRLGHEIDLAVRLIDDVWTRLCGHRYSGQKEQSEQQNFFHTILIVVAYSTWLTVNADDARTA